MPDRVRSGAALAQVRCDHGPEVIDPASNRFVRDRYTPFGQQVFDVSETQSEQEIQPDGLVNDLGRKTVPRVADFPHPLGYCTYVHPTSCRQRDKARATALSRWSSRSLNAASKNRAKRPSFIPKNRKTTPQWPTIQ